jgi:hypothetical protein
MPHLPITLMIENWTERPIDGKLLVVERASYHGHTMNVPPASSLPDGIAGCQGKKSYDLEEGDHR